MRNSVVIGDRVYLRPFELSDAEPLAEATAGETETFFERGRYPASPLAFEHWITELHRHQPPKDVFFAVCLNEDDRLIGLVGVDHLDWIDRTGETGITMHPGYRDQGYGTEAKHLLIEYCFDVLQLHALRSHVWEPNTRSAAAVLKQGYRPAGRLKWDEVQNGVYRDVLVFDLLREDWLAARAAGQVD